MIAVIHEDHAVDQASIVGPIAEGVLKWVCPHLLVQVLPARAQLCTSIHVHFFLYCHLLGRLAFLPLLPQSLLGGPRVVCLDFLLLGLRTHYLFPVQASREMAGEGLDLSDEGVTCCEMVSK